VREERHGRFESHGGWAAARGLSRCMPRLCKREFGPMRRLFACCHAFPRPLLSCSPAAGPCRPRDRHTPPPATPPPSAAPQPHPRSAACGWTRPLVRPACIKWWTAWPRSSGASSNSVHSGARVARQMSPAKWACLAYEPTSEANRRTMPRPMPAVDAVTIATLPSSLLRRRRRWREYH
jgi:hypothetical protein